MLPVGKKSRYHCKSPIQELNSKMSHYQSDLKKLLKKDLITIDLSLPNKPCVQKNNEGKLNRVDTVEKTKRRHRRSYLTLSWFFTASCTIHNKKILADIILTKYVNYYFNFNFSSFASVKVTNK